MQQRMPNIWPTSRSIFVSLILLFAPLQLVQAEAFTFDRFTSDITINADGSFDVIETIEVNFAEERHGIYRAIPTRYTVDEATDRLIGVSEVSVTDALGNDVEALITDDGWLNIRIGSPDVTVIGAQTYVISYQVDGALLRFDTFDELYWNVTGSEWDAPPTQVTARIHLPDALAVAGAELMPYCYTGSYASTASDCLIDLQPQLITMTTENNFLTVALGWPQGTIGYQEPEFVAPVVSESLYGGRTTGQMLWVFATSLIVPIITFMYVLRYWRRHGKDPKGRGTIVPEYDPPKGIKPSELGIVFDNSLSPSEMSAAIVDLAVRGHLLIKEVTVERFGPDKQTYELEKRTSDDPLRDWEKLLLEAIFVGEETTVSESTLVSRLPEKRSAIEDALYETVVKDGYYLKNPKQVRIAWIVIGGILIFIGGGILPIIGASLFPTGIILIVFGWLMPKRTELGVKTMEQAKGFKMFLETAEKYRLEWQEKEGIFEKFLPFAMVFGVSQKWAKAFATIHATQSTPAWYVGTHAFSPVLFADSMESINKSFATAMAPMSSGSGGGGSSGGGFGGGGGGSW